MADKTKNGDHEFPFDNDALPFPHKNAPNDQNAIDAPADGQFAFEFVDGVYPPDLGVQIESPDLTDEKTFANLPTSYYEHVAALKKEGAIAGEIDDNLGATLEQPNPETFAIVNETTEEPKSTSAEAIQESEADTEKTEEKAEEKKEAAPAAAPKRRTRADVASE